MQVAIKDIKISKQVAKLTRDLDKEEYRLLKKQINEAGGTILTPLDINVITTTKGKTYELIDGRNRLKVAKEIGLDSVPCTPYNNLTEEEITVVIAERQLGRRNLSPQEFKLLLGLLFNASKQARGGDRKSEEATKKIKGQKLSFDPTIEGVAKAHGVSKGTVKSAGKLAEEVTKKNKKGETLVATAKRLKEEKKERSAKDDTPLDEAYRELARAMTVIRSRYKANDDQELREWVVEKLTGMLIEAKKGEGVMQEMSPQEILNS